MSLTSTEVQEFFEMMRQSKFSGDTRSVSYERTAGGGEIQPHGWTINREATVIIDDAGITIEDGALTLRDAYGEAVLSGAGFSGTWDRYISSGLYNNNFAAATIGAVQSPGFMIGVPYWSFARTQSYLDLTPVAESTASGGVALRLDHSSGASTGIGAIAAISQAFQIVGGRRYAFEASVRHSGASAPKPITYWAWLTFYDATGAVIGSPVSMPAFAAPRFGTDLASFTDVNLVTATAPLNAASAKLDVNIEWVFGMNAGSWVEVNEVSAQSEQTRPGRISYRDTSLNIPGGGVWTAVTGISANNEMASRVTHNRYGGSEFTVDQAGVWDITVSVIWDANTTGRRGVGIAFADQATPTMASSHQTFVDPDGVSGLSRFQHSVKKRLVEGNTFIPFVQQTSGGTLALTYCRVEAIWLGM